MTQIVLNDTTKSGYRRNWKKYHQETMQLSRYLVQLKLFKQAQRVKECAEVLQFTKIDDHLKLKQAWFCKNRLCSLCNWRQSMKDRNQIHQLLTVASERLPTAKFLFLTLTVKNVSSASLHETLRQMGRAVSKLFQRKIVKESVLGYIRTTEITVNHDAISATYHPHMHLLILVDRSYKKGSSNYIYQEKWVELWQTAMQLPYTPDVDIRTVGANKPKQKDALLASASETGKYQVKSIDFLTDDDQINIQTIAGLTDGLAGTRRISYSGLFKVLHHELHLPNSSAHDVACTAINDPDDEFDMTNTVTAQWNYKKSNYMIDV